MSTVPPIIIYQGVCAWRREPGVRDCFDNRNNRARVRDYWSIYLMKPDLGTDLIDLIGVGVS